MNEAQDLTRLPLDRLRQLAESGPDAATKAAAQRAIRARTEPTQSTQRAATVTVATTAYGTRQPELRLEWNGATAARELRATLHELAAQAERLLSRTPEMWAVTVRIDEPPEVMTGAVCLELMVGDEAEATRACALLQAILPASNGKKKRGRKPKVAAPVAPKARPNGASVANPARA